MIRGVPLVEVTRGPLVESIHSVAACAVDAHGTVVLALGDIDVPVFLRSTAKPFIAAAIVAAGTAERFALTAQELAVIAASHDGEPIHVAAVRRILAKIELPETALQCGAHAPASEAAAAALARAGEAPSALYNNCSGKHAGILAMCVHLGLGTERYLEPGHPAERRILEFCARMTGDDAEEFLLGVDGCGIPVFATSLRKAARAFARLATLREIDKTDARALQMVRAAMIAEPLYVGGTTRFDSALLVATQGRVVGKGGAEGVHGDALVREGLGLALKVVDGARRATPPAAAALLEALGALDAGELAALEPFVRFEVRNVAGRAVGRIEARLPDTILAPSSS
ncbi:MAG TPA: asparaginase [Candidatus Baltobacteraceae bacterium]|nr:asparaginase [Candidatus Baltobacteraceae bacterium]